MEEEAIIREWNERQRERERQCEAFRVRPIYVYVKIRGTHNSNASSLHFSPFDLHSSPHVLAHTNDLCRTSARTLKKKQTNAYVKFHCCIEAPSRSPP